MASREFKDQLTKFLPKMSIWALALTRNATVADDLVQDVALKTLIASESCCAQSPRNYGHRAGARDGRRTLAAK
jgi:DNA-directed RNA polymerase specialized sigma24 family protein